jgi:hypothetical protein
MCNTFRVLISILFVLPPAGAGEAQTALTTQTAQLPQVAARTVRIEEADDGRMHWLQPKINQEVIEAFAARVAASSRYIVTQAPAEILVVIVCQDGRKANATGGFCTYKFEYSPKSIPEFNMPLGAPNIVAHPGAADIAEDIFQDFVKETTETRLSVAELEVNLRVANFCSKPANQLPCSGKLQ